MSKSASADCELDLQTGKVVQTFCPDKDTQKNTNMDTP